MFFNRFPHVDAFFMTPLKQTTFEIIVANGEIAHNEQFLQILSQ